MIELNQYLCACTELDVVIPTIQKFLLWAEKPVNERESYAVLFETPGVYYIIANHLDDMGLIEHGVSIRYPFLTGMGKRVLAKIVEEYDD